MILYIFIELSQDLCCISLEYSKLVCVKLLHVGEALVHKHPKEDWDRVFSAFARLDDSRTRASGGYGLGLSIVRRIMYWHGGRAMVGRSDELGGARFSLIWPRVHTD